MASNELKVGDPVRFAGQMLTVAGFLEGEQGHQLVECAPAKALKRRAEARGRIVKLRQDVDKLGSKLRAEDITPAQYQEQHDKIAATIKELDKDAAHMHIRVRLRVDLLTQWPEFDFWTSEGRALSSGEIIRSIEAYGITKPRPLEQRSVYSRLQRDGLLDPPLEA
jgi:hypothetical protein